MRSMRPIEWGMLLLLSSFWGCSFFFIEIALRDFHPFTLVFFRVTLAALTLVGVVYLSGHRLPAGARAWGGFLILGAINNALPFSLIVWGQTRIDSGSAAIFNATTPIFAGVLAHFFTEDEKLNVRKLVGMLVGFFGVYMMMRPEMQDGLSWRGFGQVAVLGASMSYATAGVFAKRFKDTPPLVTATGMLICSSLLILPLAIIFGPPWSVRPSWDAAGALIALAVVGTATAYVLFFRILSTAGATNVLLVTFLVPIGALILGIGVLHEAIHLEEFTGMGLIFLGLVFIDGRVPAYIRHGGRH